MTIRTTLTTATFASPLPVQGKRELLPLGSYEVKIDEDAM